MVDPLAGSYYVEHLTDEIEVRVFDLLEQIEALGGAVEAVKSGFYHKAVAESAYELQKKIENKEKIVVGVNEYISKEEPPPFKTFSLNEKAEAQQIERLNEVRKKRDNKQVQRSLKRLREALESDENIIPSIIEGVRVYASVGEIGQIFRDVYGEYQPYTGI